MATDWLLLLLLLVASSQSADSQSMTGNETRDDIETILETLQQLSQSHEMVLENQQKILDILQQHQIILNRLSKCLFPTNFEHNYAKWRNQGAV